jgi:hypothetical protein
MGKQQKTRSSHSCLLDIRLQSDSDFNSNSNSK